MEQWILDNIESYGLIAVFVLLMLSGVGLALGEEMVTIPAGIFIADQRMDFLATAVVCYVAIVLADFLWFAICRHYGTRVLHARWVKRIVHPRRLLEAKHQLERRGAGVIVAARFIPSSRTTAITVAGMFHMPFWKFALATCSCVAVTVPLQLGFGWMIGHHLGTEGLVDIVFKSIGAIVLVVVVVVVLNRWRAFRESRSRLPRARAAWLRRFRRSAPSGTGPARTDPPA